MEANGRWGNFVRELKWLWSDLEPINTLKVALLLRKRLLASWRERKSVLFLKRDRIISFFLS